MHIALLQTNLHWEDPQANRGHLEEIIWGIKQSVDVIVLPEMFTTGFSTTALSLAEPTNLTTHKWLKQMAAQTNAVITGSYLVKEGEHFFNRLIWMQPDGIFYSYNKRHLFTYGKEDAFFTAGTKQLVVEWRDWKFCPLICYDLRFPVWSCHTTQHAYDCLLYVANWPQKRSLAWNTLLRARAIENVSYCVGVNRTGLDGAGLLYGGDSAVYDYQGNEVVHAGNTKQTIVVELHKKPLFEFRTIFPALHDGDSFSIE